MIFITVGTHEQGMDRLFIEIDKLIDEKIITDEVFAQIGYTKYKPKNFNYKEMIGYDEMDNLIKNSSIIITHGGPGSIFHPLRYGKIPIVVPRNPQFYEHVDNHQILFTKRLEESEKIIAIYNIKDLKDCINNYEYLSRNCNIESEKKQEFIKNFESIVIKLLK